MRDLRGSTLVLLLLTACGGEGAGSPPEGSPTSARGVAVRWRAPRDPAGVEGTGILLEAVAPCRVSMRFDDGSGGAAEDPPRPMFPGDLVIAWWKPVDLRTEDASRVPPPEQERAGRTQPMATRVRFGFHDRITWTRTFTAWTRPERGRRLRLDVDAPVRPLDLRIGERLELLAVAVADVASGEARWVAERARAGSRIDVEPRTDGDVVRVARLWLEVSPPEPR